MPDVDSANVSKTYFLCRTIYNEKNDDLGLAHRQKSTGEKHDFVLRRGLMVSKSILIEKAEGQKLSAKLLYGFY
jgi:hypothetical protein